jgi:hypothetical protein
MQAIDEVSFSRAWVQRSRYLGCSIPDQLVFAAAGAPELAAAGQNAVHAAAIEARTDQTQRSHTQAVQAVPDRQIQLPRTPTACSCLAFM